MKILVKIMGVLIVSISTVDAQSSFSTVGSSKPGLGLLQKPAMSLIPIMKREYSSILDGPTKCDPAQEIIIGDKKIYAFAQENNNISKMLSCSISKDKLLNRFSKSSCDSAINCQSIIVKDYLSKEVDSALNNAMAFDFSMNSLEKSAEAIASRMVRALNFGKNTAMGEFETQESVESLTLGDIKEAYNNFITPSRAYLIFSGDITLAEAKKIANEYLGDWKGKTLTFPTIAPEKSIAKTEVDIIDLPSAVQAQLFVTNLITNPMTNPDYFALTLTNQILGGGSEGKLFQNLREKRGFTYGSYSSIGSGRFQSLVSSSAQVRTEKVDSAVAEIMAEVKNMQNGNFTQKDLDLVKAKYNGSFALNMENPELAASYALNILTNNLPKDFYRTFLQKINAVTLADIKRVSQKYLSTDKARIIIVGNAEQITPGLKKLGYNIKNFDAYGNPVKASAPVATDASMTAEKVIDKYLKAVGGKDALQKINTYSATVSMDMGGQKLSGSMKKMAPYSTSMELTMNGMSAFKMMFDGTSGYQAQMGQKSPFGEEEIKIQKDEKGIFPQLHYGEASYKVSLEGSSKVNGEDAYKVKVIKPSGNVSHEFYSIKTGYLLKQTSTLKAQGQEMEQTVEFGDYKDIGGIMTPTSITQLAGGQELPMKLSDIKYNSGVTAEDFK